MRSMSSDAIAVLGFVVLFVLMLLRVPVGMAMGLVGVSGFAYIVGGAAALKSVGHTTMRTVTDYNFAVVPLFLLMGSFASTSGMSRELFRGANAFLGHLRGGLGIATIAACGGFAAICGSSVATAATFSRVAYPEMRPHGYPQSFATGVMAAGGARHPPVAARAHAYHRRGVHRPDRCAAVRLFPHGDADAAEGDRVPHRPRRRPLRRARPDHGDVPGARMPDGCAGHDHPDGADHLSGDQAARLRPDLVRRDHRDDGRARPHPPPGRHEHLRDKKRDRGRE